MPERRNRVILRNRAAVRSDAGDAGRPLGLNRLVAATHDIREGLKIAPRGAIGVVTHVFAHGVGYEVRFSEPSRVTLCASRADLALI
jgi:hypothetical protein